ncbi:hypothetical protein BJV78DRAFT_1380100 [Lactifluus subvellereus]|nr:hypothetical protein BJV78DRAFT_1380100 [Lactifluus subvellereus]
MPTTSTITMTPTIPSTPFIPFKAVSKKVLPQITTVDTPPSPPTSPQRSTATAATLRPLYARAVRAFLHRDIVLTHSLLTSAFALITPPTTSIPDTLSDHRRKWDVLRITLDVTVYTAPPADTAIIPAALRSNALLSGAALLATLHTRSVRLFAPTDGPALNPAFLPPQVLVTLALSSVKIGCPAAGRGIIEEWLACRIPTAAASAEDDGYEKVLEVYCLSILPALGEWTYARQFLGYETELPAQSRENLASSLASLYEQHLTSLIREPSPSSEPTTPKPPPSTPSTPAHSAVTTTSARSESSSALTPTPSRPSSPTPSSSSASSNSTHTAVPTNPHPRASRLKNGHGSGHDRALAPLTSTLSTAPPPPPPTSTAHDASSPSSSRAVPRGRTGSPARRSRSQTPATTEPSRPGSWYALTRSVATVPSSRTSTTSTSSGPWPMTLESVHAALRPYLRHAPLFLLLVVLPALAMFVRILRRRPKSIAPSSATAIGAAVAAGVGAGGAGAGGCGDD